MRKPPIIAALLLAVLSAITQTAAAQGNFVIGDTPEQFSAYIRSEYDKWARVVKAANIKPE
ncbi:MAG: hypothetical protein K8S22_00965 [Betaproteobacteria bacterium]|nr:hypothetical protein [Betaproteobacteria bacterium]